MNYQSEIAALLQRVGQLEADVNDAESFTLMDSGGAGDGSTALRTFQIVNGIPGGVTLRFVQGGVYLGGDALAETADPSAAGTVINDDTKGFYGHSPAATTYYFVFVDVSAATWTWAFAQTTGAMPTSVADTYLIIPIAKVPFDGGNLDWPAVLVYHEGDVHLGTAVEVDDLSTQFNDDGEVQIWQWDDPSGDTYVAVDQTDDLFMFREYDDASLKYITLESMMQSMSDWSGVDLTGASWTDPPWDDPGESYKSHHALDAWDAVDESVGEGWNDFDDHGVGSYGGAFAAGVEDGYPLMLIGDNGTDAACYDRNKISGEFNFLGESTKFETAIYVDSIYDESETAEMIAVASRQLTGGVWEVTSTAGSTTVGEGALLVDGGLSVAENLYADGLIYANEDGSYKAVLGNDGATVAGFFQGGGGTLNLLEVGIPISAISGVNSATFDMGYSTYGGTFTNDGLEADICSSVDRYAFDAITGHINIADTDYVYKHGGVAGASQTSPALVIGDASGGSHTYYLRGGILCEI